MGMTARCECGNRMDSYADLCRRCSEERGRTKLWRRSACIRALEDWVEEHGDPPTYDDWATADYTHPTSRTCARIFGTWTKFIEAGGHKAGKAGGKRYWTRNQIANAMLDFRAREGRWPTMREWKRAHPDGLWPSQWRVRSEFGGWIRAEQYAGRELTEARKRKAGIA